MSITDVKLLVKLIKLLTESQDEFTWNYVYRTNENWQLSSSHVKLSDYFEDVNSPTDTELSLFALGNPSLTFIYWNEFGTEYYTVN